MTAITLDAGPVVRISDSDLLAESVFNADHTVTTVGSTGVSAVEPLVTVTFDGQTAFYVQCSSERVREIISRIDKRSGIAGGDPDAVLEHEQGTTQFPVPQIPGLSTGTRDVLSACGWRRPTNTEDHAAAGGFGDPSPEMVLDAGETIRGRGWGDLHHDVPLAETWETVRGADDEKIVVVNAHGNAADTLLLGSAPFEVLEGAVTLADIIGAGQVIVYASAEDELPVRTVREAIDNYPDLPVEVDVVTGPTEYRAAEPTMAIEAIEGAHRLEARIRPPDLDEIGLNGCPTLVHTPRTFAHLTVTLREGEPPKTRLMTVTGDVSDPATVEVPEVETLDTVVDAVDVPGEFKAALIGGRFGGVTGDLDVCVEPGELAEENLGSEGVVHVLTDNRCVVEFVGQRAQFAAEKNCGRCVPCREGTTQLAEFLRGVYDGEYAPDEIEELIKVMTTSSICAFGVQAGRPTRTALTEFKSEFEAHANGQCPADSCFDTIEA